MKSLSLLLLLSSLLFSEMLERTQVMMGTFVTITLPEGQEKALQRSFEILRSVEKALSSYDVQADIYRLNHERSVTLTPYSYEALRRSLVYYQQSDGYFDIAIGAITKGLYRFGEEEAVATQEALAAADTEISGLHFTPEKAWLDAGVMIDLGGMGKGFGVDKAAAYLKAQKIREGVVALSGDIRCLGPCEMAIQDPFGEGVIATFRTKSPDTAVSTSGNYRRFIESKKNNHLIDPKSKASQQTFASITLFSHGDNSDLDAYATAASVMPFEKARTFLARMDVGHILITNAKQRFVSSDIDAYVKELHWRQR